MTSKGAREMDIQARLDAYVDEVVDAAPPLSEAPPEAETAIRALGNYSPAGRSDGKATERRAS
jgi:hypothetical protein